MGLNIKKRFWAFCLYPESARTDWKEQLQLLGLTCAVSPLHDKDINADGSIKKPHYHIILCYNGPTTYNNVKSLTVDSLNGTIPQPLESIKGYYRYLTHKDNPEKVQYSEQDIISINGFNIFDFVDCTSLERTKIKAAIIDDILELEIREYSHLLTYYKDNDMTKFEVASSNTLLFQQFLISLRCSEAEKERG